ncbi:hypothetical protein BDEG_20324 [Batrachochytrium dendrobatidis JEL423]|uniref:Uncharacterized protein n=1 Tax=Batrachochytrium dendrobatidis (strain JEL423) TaxID=403673 RepID=A0A177W8M3_BATDL|nr:hypothetical protein BDEG_20324 [Batrachochytrium dendrobatidis JEL423]
MSSNRYDEEDETEEQSREARFRRQRDEDEDDEEDEEEEEEEDDEDHERGSYPANCLLFSLLKTYVQKHPKKRQRRQKANPFIDYEAAVDEDDEEDDEEAEDGFDRGEAITGQ